ncbi:glycerophosphodiester phosphodiesterase family protein [Reichenbachiella agarivorans]|uniref:Glycerophosphodiester phosphodiesterase family protein n=1 Tax=Reichenbachiella agarivorans TaxID=2979464 RepID=A0ABY6CP64_9BACT|nr:glycerophosphodiester phosphodiesterase family protein [Reichenbachiella agarivorans]UXP32311.1 glycerophosphodiester phosphodiesterase family protein [Reichenbachiella agarivorans]
MNSRNFIWYAIPMMLFLALMWLFEPWFYQRYVVSDDIEDIKKRNFVIVGHKGASGVAPENTLAAFQKAIDMGADMVEIDVHYTKDGEVVVFHDEDVDRTTNGTGKVHKFTLAELKELDAGSWFGDHEQYRGEKIPTLAETLDLIHGKVECVIDIKSKGHEYYDGFAERVVEIINEKGAKDWTVVQAYDESYLEEALETDSTIRMKKIMMGEDETHLLAFYINAKTFTDHRGKHEFFGTLNPHFTSLSQRRLFRFKARGYKVFTYVVNERDDMIKMLNMGVDGIITDFPDRMVEIRKELEAIDREKAAEEEG